MSRVVPMFPGKLQAKEKKVLAGDGMPEELDPCKAELKVLIKKTIQECLVGKISPWIEAKVVMEILNLKPDDLKILAQAGRLPFYKVGKNVYYDPIDVEKELRRRKMKE